ncbi:protein kinase domain-containing protein [Nonomuraea typhae]|uniref:protein kinase domain-containing protein n=1 Tax=Nonomuraea typhae TaxID=2603600 RepID=UPI0015E1C925|nr:serine/threonine-protein kinase [Nonomuraea typhae]
MLDAELTGGRPYIVSEYVAGPSLRRAAGEVRRFQGDELHRLGTAVATALTAIHEAGVVHRDLKPDNVLLGPDGPRVIDFGIARAADMSLTGAGQVAGTPGYIAPEVLIGQPAGAAADVFAWGAVMVFAATGADPFGGPAAGAAAHRVLTVRPDLGAVPASMRPWVEAALAKDPGARPTARELLLALVSADGGEALATGTRAGAGTDVLAAGSRVAAGALAPGHADPPLGTLAEDAYAGLGERDRGHAPGIFLRLVAMGARGAVVDELGERARPVLDAFRYVLAEGEGRVTLTHPVLARAWPRLRAWVAAESDGLPVLAEISVAARAWQEHGRREGDLLSGIRLEQAMEWAATGRVNSALTARERAFLQAATSLTRRRDRRRRALTTVLFGLTVLAYLAVVAALWQADRAGEQRDLAAGRQLVGEADGLRVTDPVRAMLLNVAGWRPGPAPGAGWWRRWARRSSRCSACRRRRARRWRPPGPTGGSWRWPVSGACACMTRCRAS